MRATRKSLAPLSAKLLPVTLNCILALFTKFTTNMPLFKTFALCALCLDLECPCCSLWGYSIFQLYTFWKDTSWPNTTDYPLISIQAWTASALKQFCGALLFMLSLASGCTAIGRFLRTWSLQLTRLTSPLIQSTRLREVCKDYAPELHCL